MKVARVALLLLVVVAVVAAAFFIVTTPPPIEAMDNTPRNFPPAQIARGAQLALMGDCIVCHTRGDGKAYAGGRPSATPFGTIYGTNITPDRETGIGTWSQAAFTRAMREGVAATAAICIPRFPTIIPPAHRRRPQCALSFLMTREPVAARAPANDLYFPLGFRPLVAGWKMLFLHRDTMMTNSAETQNGIGGLPGQRHRPLRRVSYAAQRSRRREARPGFCRRRGRRLAAPALDTAAPAPVPWTRDAMVTYLTAGVAARREVAAGPMAPVTHDLSRVDPGDVRAIAVYMAAQGGEPSEPRRQKSDAARRERRKPSAAADAATATACGWTAHSARQRCRCRGLRRRCASCHDSGRGHFFQGALNLRLSTSVNAPNPTTWLASSCRASPGRRRARPWMPALGPSLTDAQLTALLTYVRAHASDRPAWRDVSASVRKVRQGDAH